jgi:hypothetical protein
MRSNSKQKSGRLARIWKRRSPGVDGAVWTGPLIDAKTSSSCGRFSKWRRSQRSRPIPTMHDRRAERSRKPTVLPRSSSPSSAEQTLASAAGWLATVRSVLRSCHELGSLLLLFQCGLSAPPESHLTTSQANVRKWDLSAMSQCRDAEKAVISTIGNEDY